MEYEIIRSNRKSVGLQVNESGLTVRAPFGVPDSEIERILRTKREWIEKSLAKYQQIHSETDGIQPLSYGEINELADRALKIIPERVAYYASKIGVKYGKITIRNQKSKWGSCSSRGDLSFNCLLMLTPPEVIDSVVVHELCHVRQMNHSEKFYAEILRVFPNYYECDRWLKQNGSAVMKRNLK